MIAPRIATVPVYRCRGCGTLDSIVEVELVPRIHDIRPATPTADDPEPFDYGDGDEAFWEGSVTLGYACRNESCRYWQGNTATPRPPDDEGEHSFTPAYLLVDVAEVIALPEVSL